MTQAKRDPGDTALPTTVEIFVERRPGGAGQPSEVDAFADLYNRTYNPLVAYCRRYCPPGYDPEDIAQEALAKAWSSWDRYSPSRPFWPWVATIARRLCVDYWRRDERAVARAGGVASLEPCPQPRPDELSEAADECRMAVTAFRRLRPDHQRIVGLRDIEGWSYEDIARFEGVTVESIRGSLRRARLSLRKSYDSLAKGGVPALAPLGLLVKSWQSARVRMATRMARWQAALQDAGMASTRLGEALVSLMAISVAAVGVGAPGGGVALQAGDTGRAADVADMAGAGTAVDSSAAAAAGAATSASSATPPKEAILNGSFGKSGGNWIDGNPLDDTRPEDAAFNDIVPSPQYEKDGTIFAGARRPDCLMCATVFRSTDRGATWTDLKTVGLTSSRILLPPAYPADNRIFATGNLGLQVSTDGGRTFKTVAASKGIAAMSPAFSSGDPRIFLPDAPGLKYNAQTGVPEPLSLKPGPTTGAQEYSFGFATQYDPANPVLYIGAMIPSAPGTQGLIHRCSGDTCDQAIALPGLPVAPRITVVPMADGRDAVLAMTGTYAYRSLDGGTTYHRMGWPQGLRGTTAEVSDARGRVYVLGMESPDHGDIWYSDDYGSTWVNLPNPGGPDVNVDAVRPLPDGALLAVLSGDVAGFACSHDGGRSWAPSC